MEVENILLAAMCRMIHRTRRVYRKHVAVVRVVFLAAIVFLCALGVSGGSRILISAGMGKTSGLQTGIIEVQAAEVEETEATEQLQAGLNLFMIPKYRITLCLYYVHCKYSMSLSLCRSLHNSQDPPLISYTCMICLSSGSSVN